MGRINGCCGTLASTPIHYIHRAVSVRELVALYCAADVMLVTPLRDGMNLVAKEFVASRINDDGVLVLSEFAGAAAELCGAVVVNPYDVETMADIMRRALEMSVDEQRTRMRAMRQRVAECDVTAWAAAFLSELHGEMPAPRSGAAARVRPSLASAIAAARKHTHLRLLLDYDGTLVPLARSPQLAAPDAMLLKMLAALALAPRLDLAIVSGRPRRTLEEWFGHLPIGLWAEHGFWHRPRPGVPWQASAHVSADWFEPVRPILEQFTASTPGSRLEIKDASLAWHYRGVPREFGARQAHELRMLLGDALSNQPLEVLEGKKVIEVRCRGINKGIIAERSQPTPAQTVIAFGDDRTDEDLFRSLPESSITVAVGARLAGAKYSVESCRSVRKLLASLVTEAAASASDRAFVSMTSTPRLM